MCVHAPSAMWSAIRSAALSMALVTSALLHPPHPAARGSVGSGAGGAGVAVAPTATSTSTERIVSDNPSRERRKQVGTDTAADSRPRRRPALVEGDSTVHLARSPTTASQNNLPAWLSSTQCTAGVNHSAPLEPTTPGEPDLETPFTTFAEPPAEPSVPSVPSVPSEPSEPREMRASDTEPPPAAPTRPYLTPPPPSPRPYYVDDP